MYLGWFYVCVTFNVLMLCPRVTQATGLRSNDGKGVCHVVGCCTSSIACSWLIGSTPHGTVRNLIMGSSLILHVVGYDGGHW